MSLGRTRSVALTGLDGVLVSVEAHVAAGLPAFTVTGLPDKACSQAPDRVRSAAVTSGAALPPRRITVNLSPASIPKFGTGFDLPIAVAVLQAADLLRSAAASEVAHIGELGLDGTIRGVRGVLPAVLAAAQAGVRSVVVPVDNVAEARLVDGVRVHAAPDLATLLSWYAAGSLPEAPAPASTGAAGGRRGDLADVIGQPMARLALEMAAIGGHHLHLSGPPGVGKTMLAERLVTILPPLTREQALQTHAIRSLAGGLTADTELDLTPPFVAPHHSATQASIVGGGSGLVVPGAISRAHCGVLFLDEAPEFGRRVLQTLRQPLESAEVVIARARQVVRYPARFMLVLAANPCPCGRGYGRGQDCTCTSKEVRSYSGRLSGPLMDRVDIRAGVAPVARAAFVEGEGESSATVLARVMQARAAQEERWRRAGVTTNGEMPGHVLRRAPWRLPSAVTRSVDRRLDSGLLSLRGYDRVLRLAWSSADRVGHVTPDADDVSFAMTLRTDAGVAA